MLLLLLLAASSAQPAADVVARFGSRPITASQLSRRLQPGADARATLEDLVNDTALAEEAQRQGYGKDPRVRAEVESRVRKLAGELFLENEVESGLKIDDRLLSDLYHSQEDSVRMRLIVLPSEKDAAECLTRLRKGASFAAEALNSLDPDGKRTGGTLGLQSRGQFEPALQDFAFRAPLKQPAGPVKLALGWGVIEVLERTVAPESGLAARREKLVAFAQQQLRRQIRTHYLGQLRKQAGVVLDEKFLQSTGKRLDATPAEEQHVVATVYGKPMRYGELLPEVRRLAGGMTGGHFSGPSVKLEVAGEEANERALGETAMRRGYGTSPRVAAVLPDIERDAMVRAFAEDLRKRVVVSDAEVEQAYRKRLAEFTRPGHRRCSHILSASEKDSESLRARIEKGARFDEVAQEESRDTQSAARGGLIGDLPDDRLEAAGRDPGQAALVKALLSTPAGAVSRPVKSSAGWHLVRCGAHVPAAPAPLSEVAPAIRAQLQREKGDEAVKAAIARARAGEPLQVNEAALRQLAGRHG